MKEITYRREGDYLIYADAGVLYMNSTYSVGAFNTNEMAFNMILKQLKIEGERTYDANTLVVIYGKKS